MSFETNQGNSSINAKYHDNTWTIDGEFEDTIYIPPYKDSQSADFLVLIGIMTIIHDFGTGESYSLDIEQTITTPKYVLSCPSNGIDKGYRIIASPVSIQILTQHG